MNRELLLKSLLYRSTHRGCKETDILIGKFAENKLSGLEESQLNLFENFILEDDAEIYDWLLAKSPYPKKYSDLIEDIRQFHDL